MEIMKYEEPPAVRHSTSSETSSVDSRRSQARSVHFDQINPTFTDSNHTVHTQGPGKGNGNGSNVVTAKDGAPVHVQEHVIKCEKRKKKVIKAPISAYAMGPWPVVTQPEDGPRTVREKHLKLYFIMSIIACVLFFPTGIPALYYAIKTKKLFYEGIEQRGEVTEMAIKSSRKCEKLLILTAICLLLVAVILFAVIEKLVHDGPTTHVISNKKN